MAPSRRRSPQRRPYPVILTGVWPQRQMCFSCAGGYDKVLLVTHVQMVLINH